MKRTTSIISSALILILALGPTFAIAASANNSLRRSLPKPLRPLGGRKPAKTVQAPAQLAGQSSTAMPGGGLLLTGGEGTQGPEKTTWLRDGLTGEFTRLNAGLNFARAYHSATILANGDVLILGGIGADGQVESRAELFDAEAKIFKPLKVAPAPRAYHTATLLTDGRVLIAGGIANKHNLLAKLEIWDPATQITVNVPGKLSLARSKHKASLQADGSVSFEGGQDSNSNDVANTEVFDPSTNTVSFGASTVESNGGATAAIFSAPANGAEDVSPDSKIVLRFSRRLRAETVNATTISLLGPEGTVATKVVPAENGRLVFVNPTQSLAAGVTYVVALNGAADENGQTIQNSTLTFTTKSSTKNVGAPGVDEEDWIPDERNFHGEWKSKHEDSPWRSLLPLRAEPGVTALAGQALALDGKPLNNVTLSLGSKSAVSDNTGRFLLSSVSSGRQVLTINGRTANRGNKEYGVFRVAVDVAAGKTTALDYTIWMAKLDTANTAIIESPTKQQLSITSPRIPGLELKLPAGTVIRDQNGQTVSQITITPIPTNRPPFPLPAGVNVPVYFTIQPGGAQIIPPRAQLIYPNFIGRKPGERIDFWNYDPNERGWYVYGQGTVTPDAKQIVPDAGVVLYEFSGAMVASPLFAPPLFPIDGSKDGDPVDLGTGLIVVEKTDLAVRDTIPITLTRTYRQGDTYSRPFGIGSTHAYEMFLVGSVFPYTYVDLILPDGGRVHYDRISPGSGNTDAIYEASAKPGTYYKSRVSWNGDGWDLKLRDGSLLVFPEGFNGAPKQCALIRMQDRNGNILNVTRNSSSNISRITTPNGRWIEFTYDTSSRVTQATDNIGRTVGYTYDASGRLWKVTDVKNGVTEYTYDSSHRMLTIKDPRGIVYLTNEYDVNGRVSKQTLADDTPGTSTDNPTYQFAYTTDSGGRIIQTDVTDPRGNIRRATFNSAGYRLTDTSALGLSEQQSISFERETGTNLLSAMVDPLGRRTEYTYDSMGNTLTTLTLAGTASAATTTTTYEPFFNQVSTVTDALNHTTSFSYDNKGNLLTITDPLNHVTSFVYNSAGQVTLLTDPLNHPTSFTYDSGDLSQITDPLSRSCSVFMDAAGRMLRVSDPSGNSTSYEYDVFNQPKKITEASGAVSEFTYDANGNLLTLKDARNNITSFSYDNSDRPLTRTDALQGSTSTQSYEYDLKGNATKLTDRRGKITTIQYDALDRPNFVGYGTTAGPTYESTAAYTYDLYDRITQIDDSTSGTINLNFDDLARTISEVTPQGTVGFTYDLAGRLIGKSVSGQSAINYSYDNANRLLSITQGLASVGFTYDNANKRTSLTLPNGIVTDYGYDDASRLTSISYRSGATVLGDLTYTYDQSGRRNKVGGSLARTGLPQAFGSATYNANNQLTQKGSATLTYDANGNLTSDGTNTYSWNARNQLTSITGGVTASFQYDSFGRRVSKTINGSTTEYLYDGVNAVQEKVGGTPTADMLTGNVDEVFSRTESAATQSVLADGLGSTVALLDSAGTSQTEYTYEPFGETGSSGSASNNSSQYTGRDNDGTGLYYYRARYYSPSLQRFISEDPAGFKGGDTNLYAYASNSPCNHTDPSGKWVVQACLLGALGSVFFDIFFGRKPSVNSMITACIWAVLLGFAGRYIPPLLEPLAPELPEIPGLGGGAEPPLLSPGSAGPNPLLRPPPLEPAPPVPTGWAGRLTRPLDFGIGFGEGFANGYSPVPLGYMPDAMSPAQSLGQYIGTWAGAITGWIFGPPDDDDDDD